MMRARLITAGAAGLCAVLVPAGVALSRSAGLYTSEQAAQGARIYAVRCAMCHGTDLFGTVETPGLRGRFTGNWAGRPLSELHAYVSRAMPQPAPGSLSAEDNARIVAFLLQQNGAPPGSDPLPSDSRSLQRLRFPAVRPQ